MKVGILLNRVNYEEKELITLLKRKGHSVVQLNNQRLFLYLQQNPLELNNNLSNLDLILQRSLSLTRGLYISAILEYLGQKIVNNYESTQICGDKLLTTLCLLKHEINTPKTAIAFTKESAIEAIEKKIKYPAIIKPIIGSWGRLIAKLDSKNMATAVLEDRETLGNIFQKIYYLQEFVGENDGPSETPTDIRVLYVGGKCIGAMGRYQKNDDFRSNIAIGGIGKKIEVTDEMERICKKIGTAVGGEILGIDLMETNDGYTCLEVNGTPQFKGISEATGIQMGEHIVEYLEEKYS